MSHEILSYIMFFVMGFAWTVYLAQEIFVNGVGLLHTAITNNDEEKKQLQIISGLHFDGMEVWLIFAVVLMEGVFPYIFGSLLTHLYEVMFLLLFALIARGISIELIYKLDSKRWQKWLSVMWLVSSIALIFLLGVFITNMFLGYPLGADGMTQGAFSSLNVAGIAGGLFYTALSFLAGAAWIELFTEGDVAKRGMMFVKKVGIVYIVPVFYLLIVMGFNNSLSSIWAGQLFTNYPILYVLPGLTVIASLMIIYHGVKQNAKELLILTIIVSALYTVTGFLGVFPDVLVSRVDPMYSIKIVNASSSLYALRVVLTGVCVFVPIIIGYQTWKYIKFKDKIALHDE